ncbi:DUF4843 domain-containing protein [Aquiflexum sp.]|uniref:DUF4843 domain-containing protein n=1 Tax=Aquiflexum sp. TaxID=1872584 RepID=UPI0035933FD1
MKKIIGLFLVLTCMYTSSCIEQEFPLFEDSLIEWDATVMNSPALGKDYPILIRVPRPTFALSTSDPLITRRTGSVSLRVNFVSPQKESEESFTYRVIAEETTAVEGVHYNFAGQAVIPANSSFADVQVQILDPGAGAGPVDLVLELIGNGTVKASERYKRVGIRISQQ